MSARMKVWIAVGALVLMTGCKDSCLFGNDAMRLPTPMSTFDGKPMLANSIHCAHIHVAALFNITLDDGTLVTPNFTSSTQPGWKEGMRGVVCASVPSYYTEFLPDSDSTYYFRTFKPDTKEQN